MLETHYDPVTLSQVERAAQVAAVPPAEDPPGEGRLRNAADSGQGLIPGFPTFPSWLSHPFSLSGHYNYRRRIQEDTLEQRQTSFSGG